MKYICVLLMMLVSSSVWAEDPPPADAPAKPKVVYFGFDPDIVTNYVTAGQKSLGYVRVTMELMIIEKAKRNHEKRDWCRADSRRVIYQILVSITRSWNFKVEQKRQRSCLLFF